MSFLYKYLWNFGIYFAVKNVFNLQKAVEILFTVLKEIIPMRLNIYIFVKFNT